MELPAAVVRIRGGRESRQGSLGQALEVLGRFRRKLQQGASFPDRVEPARDMGPAQWRLEETSLVFSGVPPCGRCHGPGARERSRGCLLWDQRAVPLCRFDNGSDGGDPGHALDVPQTGGQLRLNLRREDRLRAAARNRWDHGLAIEAAPPSGDGMHAAGTQVTLTAVPEHGGYFRGMDR